MPAALEWPYAFGWKVTHGPHIELDTRTAERPTTNAPPLPPPEPPKSVDTQTTAPGPLDWPRFGPARRHMRSRSMRRMRFRITLCTVARKLAR